MSFIARFVRPEDDLPAWVANFDPDRHEAEMTLRDVQMIAERVAAEYTVVEAWATHVNGRPGLAFCGRGALCSHKIEVGKKDSFLNVFKKIDREINAHLDRCCGRAEGRQQQMTLSLI